MTPKKTPNSPTPRKGAKTEKIRVSLKTLVLVPKPKPRKAAPKVKAVEAWCVLTKEGTIHSFNVWSREELTKGFPGKVIRVRISPIAPPAQSRAKRKAVKP